MNENNMNYTNNTVNGYPQSTYPQSGYSQSQQPFPQSAMQYPMSGYAEEKNSKTWNIAIISIVAVLIVALATTVIVVLKNRTFSQNNMMQPPPGTMISISKNGSMVNGRPANIESFISGDGKAYLNLEDISSTVGYTFTREGNQIKLLSQMELAIIEVGSTKVTLQDQASKATTTVEILKAPFDMNGNLYIYARDLSVFMKNTNVTYNSTNDSVEISIGMGGPGAPPMGGQPPALVQDGGNPTQSGPGMPPAQN